MIGEWKPLETSSGLTGRESSREDMSRGDRRLFEKAFEEKYRQYRAFLSFNNLKSYIYDFTSLKKEIQERDDFEPSEKEILIQDTHAHLLACADAAMKHDVNLGVGLNILEALGRTDIIKKRLLKGHLTESGNSYKDLVQAFLKYGDERDAAAAVQDYVSSYGSSDIENFEQKGFLARRTRIIMEAYSRFAKQCNLPLGFTRTVFETPGQYISAAMELKREGYDLAIGVLNSGIDLAAALDFIGLPTRYAEWHRDWKKGPVWRKMGSDMKPIRRAKRVLVCEHDTHTGTTMRALVPFLEKLQPDVVDVVFRGDPHGTNAKVVGQNPIYHGQRSLVEIANPHYVQNVIVLSDRLEKSSIQMRPIENPFQKHT